jgi:hypothetical protein
MPAVSVTQGAEKGGSRFEASQGKVSARPFLKNKLKLKGLGAWLKPSKHEILSLNSSTTKQNKKT